MRPETFLPERLVVSFDRRTMETPGRAVNNGLDYPFIISLAINSSGDIFAGTFEGGGVYRSTDNGENWTSDE